MTANSAKLQTALAATSHRLGVTEGGATEAGLEVEVDKPGTDGSELGAAVAEVLEPPETSTCVVELEPAVAAGVVVAGCAPADAPFLQYWYDQRLEVVMFSRRHELDPSIWHLDARLMILDWHQQLRMS